MWVLLLLCLAAHLNEFSFSAWMANFSNEKATAHAAIIFGLCYFLYPLCGWLTEVYSSNSRIVKRSFIPMLMSSIALVAGGLVIKYRMDITQGIFVNVVSDCSFIAVIIPGLVGLSMFEANGIQFGMDLMMDASSEQLSSFIHWYFWCTHVGPLVIYYSYTIIVICVSWIRLNHAMTTYRFYEAATGLYLMGIAICQVLVYIVSLLIVSLKRVLPVEAMSRNSLKLLYQVLKYLYHHKYPVSRTALSYWENDVPSRIDLGKDKYGGPFTYEQVEDVKTFFRLLLLMASLFGFFLLGDGYSLTQYILKHNGCPPFFLFIIAYLNPQHLTLLTVLIGIPLFRCLRGVLLRYIPSLLSRLWIGLYVALIAVALQTLLSLLIHNNTTKLFDCGLNRIYLPDHGYVSSCAIMHLYGIFNGNFTQICPNLVNPDNIAYVFIAPLFLHGVSYLLVFMTMLEFICAQAPNSMKGLLIGIWYSMLSIKYCAVFTLDIYLQDTILWYIYNLAKGVGIFVSIIMFSLAYKYYRYRERNEVVNYQNMIERIYEKELLIKESSELNVSVESVYS